MNSFIGKIGGRKFILALVAIVVTGLMNGLDPETKGWIISVITGGFSVGQGMADGLSKGKTSTTEK